MFVGVSLSSGQGVPDFPMNAKGYILSPWSDGTNLVPVICGHGGSEWLCGSCASAIYREAWLALHVPTGIERYFAEHPEASCSA